MRPIRYVVAVLAGAAVFFLAANAGRAAADEPEIAVELEPSEIFIGESADYVVEIRNVQNPSAPDLTALRSNFDVVAAGDESHNQSSTFIINGRVTQQNSFGHAYRFRLTPKRTGRIVIPGPSATIDGKVYSGRARALNVIAPEPQDLVVPEIKTDRTKVYPTQPFEVVLRVLVHPLPDDPDRDPLYPLRRSPPHLEINWVEPPTGLAADDKTRWLERLLSQNGSGFTLNDVTTRSNSFFEGPRHAVFSLYQGRDSRKGLDGRPVNYFVYELKRKLTAQKAGMYTMGPAVVKGSFVDEVDGSRYTGRRLVAVAPKVSVEVRDVPVPRPATYCGGIGSYRVSASASPTALRVGDPLKLTLEFERGQTSGSLDLISAPDLAANPQVLADFEVLDKNPTGRAAGDVKKFEYALRPKRAGVALPALAVAVFSPDTEEFSEIATSPIALTVSAATRLGAGELVGSVTGSAAPEIKSRAQGIYQNVTDPSELSDQHVNVAALAEMAAGLWCAVGCLIAVVSVHRRKSGDVAWLRKRQARRTAMRKLADARKAVNEGQSLEAVRATRSALLGLVADMGNMVAEGLTASEADDSLAETAVPADLRAELRRLLDAIESAEYGIGIASEAPAMITTAERLVPSLARRLERGA
jgi:hypothetical protein